MARILVATPDPQLAALVADALAGAGHELVAETHSLRVYDRAKDFRPDLVVLDLAMPYLTGRELLRIFSFDEELRTVPILLIVGEADASYDVEHLPGVRPAGLVREPFEISDLLQRIEQVLAAGG